MRVEKKSGAISICATERCYCKNGERQVDVEKEERRPLLVGKVPGKGAVKRKGGLRMKEAHHCPALQ